MRGSAAASTGRAPSVAPAAASQPAYTQIGRPQRATSCASPKKHGNDKQSARQSRTMAT